MTSPIPQPAPRKHLYLIDGSGFIFRAYHALPPLTSPRGVPVGAVYGFVNMLTKLTEKNDADYIAVVFDAARKTFRNDMYDQYKANRPPAPDDLIPQFSLIREATDALCIPRIELENYEADDIIATYAHAAQKDGLEVTIVSSDKDLMQLIAPGIGMYDAMKQKNIGPAEVMEKFGVTPDKVCDVLSLIGDSSDNVPGVPGIGPKTAAELIGQFGTLEALLEGAAAIKQPKRREAIQLHAEAARLSKKLICLHDEVPLPSYTELAARPPQPEKLAAFLQDMGFKSMLMRVTQKHGIAAPAPVAAAPDPDKSASLAPPTPAPVEKRYSIVRSVSELTQWIARAQLKGRVAFDTETTSLNAMQARLVGFSLCVEAGEACYVPLAHSIAGAAAQASLFGGDETGGATTTPAPGQMDCRDALALIKGLLEDDSVVKIGHNIKYDMLVMHHHGIRIAPVEDSMLLSYVLNGGRHNHGMDELAERYLNYNTITYDSVTGTGKNRLGFGQVDIEKAAEYAAEDADITLRLFLHFRPQLAPNKLTSLYDTIERPLIAVLAGMEETGIKVDVNTLTALSADFAGRMAEFEREIYGLAGADFNIGSPKQLGEILFEKLQLPGGRKSAKTGAYTTDSDVLESLAEQGHALPARVLEWRQLAKLKSTYTDALVQQINPVTRRVHTTYSMTGAATGRLSSNDPNLQNIPIRTEEGRKIRSAFIAEPGWKLLSADYSQIELRLLAHIAGIPTLKEAFSRGQDIHAITASQMFGMPVAEVSSDLRRKAKTINFGIIYGISAHGLATRLGISRGEAAAYIESYFAQYPGIKDYMERAKAEARAHGYVTTLFGRRIHLPGINDRNGAMRQFSERAAINAPLQGTAADIIKRAMIAVSRAIAPLSQDIRLLLQVHDELVFEVKDGAESTVLPLIRQHMEGAASLSVPLTVETGVGMHWGEAH